MSFFLFRPESHVGYTPLGLELLQNGPGWWVLRPASGDECESESDLSSSLARLYPMRRYSFAILMKTSRIREHRTSIHNLLFHDLDYRVEFKSDCCLADAVAWSLPWKPCALTRGDSSPHEEHINHHTIPDAHSRTRKPSSNAVNFICLVSLVVSAAISSLHRGYIMLWVIFRIVDE